MPIQSSLLTKKLLRELSRERELMIMPRAAETLHPSCPLITPHHRLLKVHRYRHHTRTKKQSYRSQDLFATFSSAPFKALGRSHVPASFWKDSWCWSHFPKKKRIPQRCQGRLTKSWWNPDKTEVTLVTKENASQDWVRCCPLQVQAFFQWHNTKDSARLILRTDIEDLQVLLSLAKASTPFLKKKSPSHRDSCTTFTAAY